MTGAPPDVSHPSDPGAPAGPLLVVRLFGSDGFSRLWVAQVLSATGDWLGFLAVVAIAGRVGGGSGAAAISVVMSARMIPGFFFSPLAGVLSAMGFGMAAGVLLLSAVQKRLPKPQLFSAAVLGSGASRVADELRGRIFSSLYTLERFCLLLSFAAGPLLADRLGALSDTLVNGEVALGSVSIALPGVRLTLWLSSITIIGAGFLAVFAFRLSEVDE